MLAGSGAARRQRLSLRRVRGGWRERWRRRQRGSLEGLRCHMFVPLLGHEIITVNIQLTRIRLRYARLLQHDQR